MQLNEHQLDYWTRCEKALKMAKKMVSSQMYISGELAKVATATQQYYMILPAVQTNEKEVWELRRKFDAIIPKEIDLD